MASRDNLHRLIDDLPESEIPRAARVLEVLRETAEKSAGFVEARRERLARKAEANTLHSLLDQIAAEFRDTPALSDEAVSRAGIYADHP